MHHPIRIRALRLGLAACLLAGALAGLASANAPTYETTILFTHDTHDHFLPMPDEEGGEYGGYTRLATLIQQERAAHPDALVLDAGDFSMGSLFQTIYATEAPELRALGAMGYDATTLGNHEFDYRARGLAEMLNAAVDSGDPVPPIVQANYKPPEEDADTWAAWDRYGIGDYLILERGGVRYGIFGLMGEEADSNAPMSGMEFEPAADAAERTVASLEEELLSRNAPYFIICLSHSGTDGRGKGEDYELAKRVDGIDVLLSVADCGLKGVSGLSFVLARRNILESSEGRARSVSLDLFEGLRRQEAGIENSLPPQAVSALHAALDALDKEGGSAVRETSCRAAAEKLAAGMIRLGFEPCLEEDARSPHVLSFLHPSDTFSFEHLQCVLRAAGWLIASAAIENRSVVSLSTLSGIDDTEADRLLAVFHEYLESLCDCSTK